MIKYAIMNTKTGLFISSRSRYRGTKYSKALCDARLFATEKNAEKGIKIRSLTKKMVSMLAGYLGEPDRDVTDARIYTIANTYWCGETPIYYSDLAPDDSAELRVVKVVYVREEAK